MAMFRRVWVVAALAAAGSGSVEAADANFPGTEDGARALLREFLRPGADVKALSLRLRPTKADYEAVYTREAAARLEATYEPAWMQGVLVIKPNPGQTEVLLYGTTSEDLKAWRGAAAEHFPGAYKDVAAQLQPRRTLYAFKFVKPGETLGMAFDGLTHVNGQWRIFPKPWRALR